MIGDKISVGSKTRPTVRDGDRKIGKDGEGSGEVGRGEEGILTAATTTRRMKVARCRAS